MNPLNWPQWLRVQVIAVGWAVVAYLRMHDGPPSLLVAAAALLQGEIFANGIWLAIWFSERRLYGKLSGPEREAVTEAIRTARPPDDPRLAGSAARVATQWAAARKRLVAQSVVFVAFLILGAVLAVAVTAWAWLGIPLLAALAWLSTRTELRQRDAAVRYLRATGTPTATAG